MNNEQYSLTYKTGIFLKKIFLFSIDLEDVRNGMPDGKKYRERVPEMTERYLEFLRRHDSTCTFFVVGDVAETYPDLIRHIAAEGHEIALHTYRHIPLTQQTPEEFDVDLQKNVQSLRNCGVENITGFRAPVFSLTEKSKWAYDVLKKNGITYSSSVLPSHNPLFGWPGFGEEFRRVENGIWELPMSLFPTPFYTAPCAGGLYFRTFPFWFSRWGFRSHWKKNRAVLSYFHPYDIDTEQEHFMHPGIKNNRFYNKIMYFNRDKIFEKIERILEDGGNIMPYRDYVKVHLNSMPPSH